MTAKTKTATVLWTVAAMNGCAAAFFAVLLIAALTKGGAA